MEVHGKKAPEKKIWAEYFYLDKESNEIKEEQLKDDMIQAAKELNHKKVVKNLENHEQGKSHYFTIGKANICREILL